MTRNDPHHRPETGAAAPDGSAAETRGLWTSPPASAADNERRFRILTENSSDIIVVMDALGRVCFMGPSIERVLDVPVKDWIGHDGFERIHADDQVRVSGDFYEVLTRPGGRVITAYRIQHRDGSWRWLESIATNLLDDPSVRGVIVNSRDVTDRVEAEAAYRTLVENSLQGLLIFQDLRIVFANEALTQLSGYSIDELLGMTPDRLREALHPDERDAMWQVAISRLDGNVASNHSELRFIHRDGSTRWIEVYASRIEYRGRPAVQVAYVDISDRKRAEDEARRHQQELAHVLRRRTMGEMAAVLAHEVNQPLTAIVSYAKGCAHRLRARPDDVEPLLSAMEEIAAQAVRAGEIIRRLRGFVRKSELQRQPVQLNALVREVLRFVDAEARERNIRVPVELQADLPLVEVDTVQIEQVVLNLLRNALEAIDDPPGERPELTIRTRCTGQEVEVAVSDTGAGLPAALAAEIFEPFITSKPEGLGMGLSICRTIVEAHGGRIWNSANPAGGTTFCFTLPLPPEPAATSTC
ncbi:MAG: PAS domain-containing sensor histidine kinase [Candidatus Binatia bacterium]